MTRRAFLLGGVGTAAVLSAGTYAWLKQRGYAVDPGRRFQGPSRPPAADLPSPPFDTAARGVLAVLVDQLLPGEPSLDLPSASEAGALDFLDQACRHRGLRPVRNDVLKLCRDLNLRARASLGRSYPDLTADERDNLLAQIRVDTVPKGRYVPQRALHTTLRILMEGYLGNPRHGGNRSAAVWSALQIPMPRDPKGHQH